MTNQPVRQQQQQKPDVNALLVSQRAQIMKALPNHLTPDRFMRIALTELRKNPELGLCDPYSFLGAVIQSAQLGLEPGSGLGHAYLIPFKNHRTGVKEVQFIPGFRGLIELARRSGQIETISARVVREKDYFEFQYGDDEKIVHRPFQGAEEDAGNPTYVYAIAKMKGGGIQREVMSVAQVERVRERKKSDNPVWKTDWEEMARKTAVRRLAKYLPLTPEMAAAIEADDTQYKGESQESWRVIDANYEPTVPAHDPEKIKAAQAEPIRTEQDKRAEAATMDADKKAAMAELQKAVVGVRKVGGDPEKILGKKLNDICLGTADQVIAAADRLSAWQPDEPVKMEK